MNKTWSLVTFILFCVGLVLSIGGGLLLPKNGVVELILVVFGLAIGIIYVLTVKDIHEINSLLLATLALLAMAAAFAPITYFNIGKMLTSMLVYFASLMSPVALIMAVRVLLRMGFAEKVKL